MTVYFFKPLNGTIVWETNAPIEWLAKNDGKPCWAELGRETGVRTLPQNASLHVLFTQIADELNGRGLTVYEVIKQGIEIDWNPKLVKELLWRSAQRKLTGKESTTELAKTGEIDEVYEHVNRHISQWGIHVPFPSEENKPKV